ncbi:MAG: PAN domain-containing protein [Deltaproteobacteria bacterium]|nr:PAN domain-containing protein [Deltaproteobacteria bacterium]
MSRRAPIAATSLVAWLATAILGALPCSDARAEALGSPGSGAPTSAPERGVDRAGFDYRNFLVEGGWETCAQQCIAEERCWSWTFVNPPTAGGAGRCWLKAVVADPTRNACCVSGVKQVPGMANVGCDALVGRWRWFNGATVECESDGTCQASHGFGGSWRCIDAMGRFEIQWSRGEQPAQFADTLRVSPDGATLSGKNQFGSGVGANRIGSPPVVVEADAPVLATPSAETSALPASKPDVLAERGAPDTFRILFLALETPVGVSLQRQEYWRYYARGEELVFVDGAQVAQADLPPLPAGTTLPEVSPDVFRAGMAFEEIAAQLGLESFVREEIPDEEGGLAELVWARQLALGFSDGELVYVESIPANAAGNVR